MSPSWLGFVWFVVVSHTSCQEYSNFCTGLLTNVLLPCCAHSNQGCTNASYSPLTSHVFLGSTVHVYHISVASPALPITPPSVYPGQPLFSSPHHVFKRRPLLPGSSCTSCFCCSGVHGRGAPADGSPVSLLSRSRHRSPLGLFTFHTFLLSFSLLFVFCFSSTVSLPGMSLSNFTPFFSLMA